MKQRDLEFDVPEPERSPALPRRRVQSVSEVTERIRGVLESELRDVWVEGEISNLKIASSGHWYFSLKDDKAQLRAVVWKNSARRMRFRPKDGMKVVARGGIRVYAPRGEYQISVELLEPLGKGSLQQAFEDLKQRLEQEGLFDPSRKRPLPLLPRRIGVVTSPTGAVVRDILRVVKRRYANLEVLIYPARVQGNEATREIVEGVRTLSGMKGLDVLMVARGGGSIEDLWAFNEEAVARALAASPIPTISAVGHETDFTIADFVADVRAPTPSAAAELVIGTKEEIEARIGAQQARLTAAVRLRLTRTRHRVEAVTSHRVFEAERGRVRTHAQQVDDLQRRSEAALERHVERQRQRLRLVEQRASAFRWERQLDDRRERVERGATRLTGFARSALTAKQGHLAQLAGKLESLSPVAVLSRGYALVWDTSRERLLRSPSDVEVGDRLRLRLSGGVLGATVTDKESP